MTEQPRPRDRRALIVCFAFALLAAIWVARSLLEGRSDAWLALPFVLLSLVYGWIYATRRRLI